jgi:hypothetical protein
VTYTDAPKKPSKACADKNNSEQTAKSQRYSKKTKCPKHEKKLSIQICYPMGFVEKEQTKTFNPKLANYYAQMQS